MRRLGNVLFMCHQDAVSMAISQLCEEGIFKIGGESLFATGTFVLPEGEVCDF